MKSIISRLAISCITLTVLFLIHKKLTFSTHNKTTTTATKKKSRGSSMTTLPSPEQHWSHATNSMEKLQHALHDDTITAIEGDLLMGQIVNGTTQQQQPIMSHPPLRISDLSVHYFLKSFAKTSSCGFNRHIKLDFKEIDVIPPTLDMLKSFLCYKSTNNSNMMITESTSNDHTDKASRSIEENTIARNDEGNIIDGTIFLNADIFPGPGRRDSTEHIDPKQFINASIQFYESVINQNSTAITTQIALSLGFKVDYEVKDEFYLEEDCKIMIQTIKDYKLDEKFGLVYALNARVLSRRPSAFDELLISFPSSQILAWTGAGEPPIPQSYINHIKSHAERMGYANRLGFDCSIE